VRLTPIRTASSRSPGHSVAHPLQHRGPDLHTRLGERVEHGADHRWEHGQPRARRREPFGERTGQRRRDRRAVAGQHRTRQHDGDFGRAGKPDPGGGDRRVLGEPSALRADDLARHRVAVGRRARDLLGGQRVVQPGARLLPAGEEVQQAFDVVPLEQRQQPRRQRGRRGHAQLRQAHRTQRGLAEPAGAEVVLQPEAEAPLRAARTAGRHGRGGPGDDGHARAGRFATTQRGEAVVEDGDPAQTGQVPFQRRDPERVIFRPVHAGQPECRAGQPVRPDSRLGQRIPHRREHGVDRGLRRRGAVDVAAAVPADTEDRAAAVAYRRVGLAVPGVDAKMPGPHGIRRSGK
jgi:hypothetical protein